MHEPCDHGSENNQNERIIDSRGTVLRLLGKLAGLQRVARYRVVFSRMSYVRLLRLPPHSHPSVAARCWRRQAGSRGGGRADNLHDSTAPSNSRQHACRQQAVAQYRSNHGTRYDCSLFARAATVRGVAGYDNQAQAGTDNVRGITGQRSANITNSTSSETSVFGTGSSLRRPGAVHSGALWSGSGTLCTGSLPRGRGAWGGQEMQWKLQSLRGFASASVPPDPKESAKESIEQPNNGQRTLPGQRVFLGGLLKPSDVS